MARKEANQAETLVSQAASRAVLLAEMREGLRIAMNNWKRCYYGYGKEVMKETSEETLANLHLDDEWSGLN